MEARIMRKGLKFSIIVGILALLAIFYYLTTVINGQSFLFDQAKLGITPSPSVEPTPTWSLLDKINEKDDQLLTLDLKVGDKDIEYEENRISINGAKITTTIKKLKDPGKEIGLKLLNIETGEIQIIKITKKGAELISPTGYNIEVVERVNGIRWNDWNTLYKVIEPADTIVVKNLYPKVEKVNGKNMVENVLYSPYSDALHIPELITAGNEYIRTTVLAAFDRLAQNKVESETFDGQLVSDVKYLSTRFFMRLPLLEQSDLTEFLLDPQGTVERVKVIIAANGSLAYSKTCSKATACGWIQFTPGTYGMIRRSYPEAGLIDDFEKGAADHVNSMMAAILLYDYNLAGLVVRHGNQILDDQRLEEYLAASYNGSPLTASKSLKASLVGRLIDWVAGLKSETKGFMAKLRYLQENNI